MKNLSSFFLLSAFLVSFSCISYAMKPGDRLDPPKPFVPVTQGYEFIKLQLNLGFDGKISFFEAKACDSCEMVRYKIDSNTKFLRAGKAISHTEIVSLNQHFATIVFEPKEHLLVYVNFYVMEEEL